MIKGPVGSGSLYVKYDATIWLYVITTIVCILLFILFLDSCLPLLREEGYIDIQKHQLFIKIKKRSTVIPSAKISKFKLIPDYRFSHEKGDKRKRILQISTDELDSSYGIEVTQPEEDELIDAIQQIIDSHQRV